MAFLQYVILAAVVSLAASSDSAVRAVEGDWSYEGKTGPRFWGDLGFPVCGKGNAQSPINVISGNTETKIGDLQSMLLPVAKPVRFKITEGSFGNVYNCDQSNCGMFIISGTPYKLLQFHIHTPSENTIDGYQSDAEIHFVHISEEGGLAVIGLMLDVYQPDSNDAGRIIADLLEEKPGASVRFVPSNIINSGSDNYFQWSGSLTTPPCSQGVRWFLKDKISGIPKRAIASILAQAKGQMNARPVQPKNGRTIRHFTKF